MRRIKQIRYYNEGNSTKNYPTTLKAEELVSGSAFSEYLPIVQLGVQALPGTQFYLNNASDPIIIGSTGIYEIELAGETQISNISFELQSVTNIHNTQNAVLIVDIIYEGEDSE